jgi:hypothetical protein
VPGGNTIKGQEIRREDFARECTSDLLNTLRSQRKDCTEIYFEFWEKVAKWAHQKVKLRRDILSLCRVEGARSA